MSHRSPRCRGWIGNQFAAITSHIPLVMDYKSLSLKPGLLSGRAGGTGLPGGVGARGARGELEESGSRGSDDWTSSLEAHRHPAQDEGSSAPSPAPPPPEGPGPGIGRTESATRQAELQRKATQLQAAWPPAVWA